MKLPNGTIIMHANTPYDPAKAHEYYLRTRQLKGRKKSSTYIVKLDSGRTVTLTSRQLTEQKVYAAKRVTEIKQKLADLTSKLHVALREAKAKKAKSTRKASKPLTAAEKSKAARESSKYQDKHKQEIATKRKAAANKTAGNRSTVDKKKPAKSNADPVKQLETKIYEVRKNLKAVVAKQRALTGATQNR